MVRVTEHLERLTVTVPCPMQELFTAQELQEKFSLDRITKSAAVFDKTKLSWMNGQYLRALPDEEVQPHPRLLL